MTIYEFIFSGICWGAIWAILIMLVDFWKDSKK